MGSLLVDDIGLLVTNDPALGEGTLGIRRSAALVVEDGSIVWVGETSSAPVADRRLGADERCVIPGFVDSHTHLIFDGDRHEEFVARMAGSSYAAGGIRSTVSRTRLADDQRLRHNASRLAGEALRSGTTTLEVKSGYGLTVAEEARSLRLAAELTPEVTFLGAHVVPEEYQGRDDDYVDLVCGPMMVAAAPSARWCDVFCEEGAFDGDRARRVLAAGSAAGLGLRVHGNQLRPGPGVQLAVEMGAASVDHATYLSEADIDALAASATTATLLPAAEFSLRSPYPDARRLLDAGVEVALATDCNPGTSYTTSMPFVIALAVREMGCTPDEALRAATLGGARALRRPDLGRLTPGNAGDLVVLDAPSPVHLAYRPGVALVAHVVRGGELVVGNGAPGAWPGR